MTPIEGRVPARLAIFHGLGSIAYGVKDNGLATFLLLYYNQVLGMNATLVSLALMLALVIDGVIDPVIGYLSDRTHSSWGRRLPWLYLAPIPLGIVWYLLWAETEHPTFWGLVGLVVAIRALVSCCEVPSVALVPELTRDYDERSRLMRYRFLFGWGGGLLVMFLAYNVFLADGLLQPEGYRAYGLTGAVLITGAVLVSALAQHKVAAGYPPEVHSKFSLGTAFAELRESFSHRAFLILLLGGGLAFIAVSGLLHVALGILCSCLTRSAALAALLTFISLLGLTAIGGAMESLPIESWEWLGWLREPAAHLRTFGHLQDFTDGVLDARPLVLYGTGTLLCLGLAVLTVEGQE